MTGSKWWTSRKFRQKSWKVIVYSMLSVGGIIILVPFLWMVSTSLKSWIQLPQTVGDTAFESFVSSFGREFWPDPVVWSNYPEALTSFFPFVRYLTNTCIITGFALLGVLISNPLVAYGFARLRAPGKRVIFIAYLSTMMIPGYVTLIPVYIIWAKVFHAIDTYYPLIVGNFFAGPFYVFLLRQFFRTIPQELSDAAKIDGCGHFMIFTRIMLPLLKPVLAVLVIFTFMSNWQDFFNPLIFINSIEKRTLALGLAFVSTSSRHTISGLNFQMVLAVVMTVPCLVLFLFTQKTFLEGITFTGIKK